MTTQNSHTDSNTAHIREEEAPALVKSKVLSFMGQNQKESL